MSGYLARLARRTLRATPDLHSAATPFAPAPLTERPQPLGDAAPTFAEAPAAFDQAPRSRNPAFAGAARSGDNARAALNESLAAVASLHVLDQTKGESTVAAQFAPLPAPRAAARHRADKAADAQTTQPIEAHAAAVSPRPPGSVARQIARAPFARQRSEAALPLPPPQSEFQLVAPAARVRPAPQPPATRLAKQPLRAQSPAAPGWTVSTPARSERRAEVRTEHAVDEPTTVHVTIGRIEIAAIHPPSPATQPARAPLPGAKPMSLDDYLARRGRR
jgi:hypothetical protein